MPIKAPRPRVRRAHSAPAALAVSALGLGVAFTGCAKAAPPTTASAPATSAVGTASAPASSTTPATSGSGSASASPTSTTPGTRAANLAPTDPTGMVLPSCPRPHTELGGAGNGTVPADLANAQYGADQQVQQGTDHNPAAASYAHPADQVQGWLRKTTPLPGQKLAFLTFDDGPTPESTPQVLKILSDNGVHATFFIIGRRVTDKTVPLLRAEIAQGNAVGIHSWGHDYHYLFPHRVGDVAHVTCDMQWAHAAISAALGPNWTPSAYRYPGGHLSWRGLSASDAALTSAGLSWIDWNAMSGDADATLPHGSSAQLATNVGTTMRENKATQVVVLLNHDFYPNQLSINALSTEIANLKAQGFSFGVIG